MHNFGNPRVWDLLALQRAARRVDNCWRYGSDMLVARRPAGPVNGHDDGRMRGVVAPRNGAKQGRPNRGLCSHLLWAAG